MFFSLLVPTIFSIIAQKTTPDNTVSKCISISWHPYSSVSLMLKIFLPSLQSSLSREREVLVSNSPQAFWPLHLLYLFIIICMYLTSAYFWCCCECNATLQQLGYCHPYCLSTVRTLINVFQIQDRPLWSTGLTFGMMQVVEFSQ